MKHSKAALTALSLSLLTPLFNLIAETPVTSSVSKVVLFQDRAEITRLASVTLSAGQNVVRVSKIPSQIDPQSLKVAGTYAASDAAQIDSVDFRTVNIKEPASPQIKVLDEKIKSLRRQLQVNESEKSRLEHERGLLESISLQPKPEGSPDNEKKAPSTIPASSIKELYGLVSEGLKKVAPDLIALNEKITDLNEDLRLAEEERASLTPREHPESYVDVTISADKASRGTLAISYLIAGQAHWNPVYNLTVDALKKIPTFTLDLFARASQNTGEDWTGIPLSFSTARPSLNLQRPEPYPLYVDVQQPVAVYDKKSMRAPEMKAKAAMEMELDDRALGSSFADSPAAPMEQATATVLDVGGIQIFVPQKASALQSDGSQTKIKLNESTLSGEIRTVAIPAISTQGYSEAVLKNTSGAPLLPGAVSVSSNGAYIGTEHLDYTPIDGELIFPIGVNDSIAIKRTLIKKYEDDSGIVKSFRRINYDYVIECENLKASPQKLTLLEGVPQSRNEKIKTTTVVQGDIKPIDAKAKKGLNALDGILEWELELQPKQKISIPFTSTIEFENGLTVTGIP